MATMRLRCIHSCMVLTVVGLLLFYSAFLTSPSYDDSTLDGGDPTGGLILNNTLIQNKLLTNAIAEVAGATFALTDPFPQTADLRVSQPQNASSALPLSEISKLISGKVDDGQTGAKYQDNNLINPTLINSVPNELVVKKTIASVNSKSSAIANANAVWTRDIYESGFSYPNPTICPNEGQDIRLVILISSAPGHFSSRDAIRLTWGHYAQRLDVSIAFIIGKTENDTILGGIEIEKHLYDDLIVANFMDSYDNLTLKTMASLEWVDTYCNQSEFVLKTDDDMFINVPNLLAFIDKTEDQDRKEPKLYGRLAKKWKPVRNKKSKYYISFQQFRKTVYPDFTTGPAYLFSSRLVRPLLEKGMEKTYLKLEDVYTTGILAQELKIKRVNSPEFANKKVNFHKTGFCALSRLISMHMVAYHEQFELWKKILDGRTKCKIIYTNASKNKAEANSHNSSPNPHNSPQALSQVKSSGSAQVSSAVTVTNSSSSSSSSSSSAAGTTNNSSGGSGAGEQKK